MVIFNAKSIAVINDSGIIRFQQQPLSNPREKIFVVGKHGACGTAGFIGEPSRNDMGIALESWIDENPNTEVKDAIIPLLGEAARVWNEQLKLQSTIPKNRKIGDVITSVICGTYVDGGQRIFAGKTRVGAGGKARVEINDIPTSQGIYIHGVVTSEDFTNFMLGKDFSPESPVEEKLVDMLYGWRRNSHTFKLLDELYSYRVRPGIAEAISRRNFAINAYAEVERIVPDEVIKPNNMRIVFSDRKTRAIRLEESNVADWN